MTAPATDRAATETLARELTDEQWTERFAELDRATWNPGTRIRESTRALLAFLDETWAGLTRPQREWLAVLCEDGFATTNHRSHSLVLKNLADKHLTTNLITREPTPTWVRQFEPTPLGRACLKRAKDQGHA